MKWLFKWLLRLVFLAVLLVVLALVFKDSVLRVVAENRIRSQTGMDVKIGKFSSGIFSPVVTVENLKLYNTAEFGGAPLLDLVELHLELDAVALAQRRLRIKLARLNLAEIDIVRNEAGQTNLFSFQSRLDSRNGLPKMPGGLEFDGIDVLNLSLGKAKFIDLKDAKNNREIRVDMQNQIFKSVKSDADVGGILFMIWLRSGGNLSIAPVDLGKDLTGRKPDNIQTTVRQAVVNPAEPVKR